MLAAHRWFGQTLASLALAVGVSTVAHAAAWMDDFNDGSVTDNNPVSWTQDPFGMFPGIYDASSGDYTLSAPGGDDGDTVVTFVESVVFADVYARTQGVILPGELPEQVGGFLSIIGRIDETLSAYLIYVDHEGEFGMQISRSGQVENLATAQLDFNGTEDIVLEINVIGTEISGFAWPASGTKPAEPQLTATNDEVVGGVTGLGYQEIHEGTIGKYRFVASQDTPFIDTTPGDFDDDGDVDGADFLLGQQNSFATLSLPAFKANYGVGADPPPPVSAVPEPSSLCLAMGLTALGVGLARRRAAL